MATIHSVPPVKPKPHSAIPFLVNSRGTPYSHLANIKIALEHDPVLVDLVHYDTFLDRVLTGTPAREWRSDDDTRLTAYLQATHRLHTIGSQRVKEVIDHHARQRPRHCVRDELARLVWDQVPRIQAAFTTYWRAVPSPQQPLDYLRAISGNFFVGLIARVQQPGCQLDEMVVFESGQGQGKTSALRVLGGPYYAASHERVTDKDFYQDLQGKWLVEISELGAFSVAQVERVKHAISTPTDRFRGSYDPRSTDHPRQCIFAGTTNADEWGNDETGLRRFWPVRCGLIDRDTLARDRDQLLAEAMVAWGVTPDWWTVPMVTAEVQEDRQISDAWSDLVLPWCQGQTEVRVVDVLASGLKLKPEQMDKYSQMRVAKILRLAGWAKRTVRLGSATNKYWYPPQPPPVGTVATF